MTDRPNIPRVQERSLKPVVLEVNHLVTRFRTEDGALHAVNGVSLLVRQGETLGIVGESGCGKSVTVLSIMKLLPHSLAEISAESIRFKGKDIAHASDSAMRKIRGSQMAMVFQDPMTSLNPVVTIGRQIMEPLRLHLKLNEEEARQRAVELLDLVGIPEARRRLKHYPHQFSGGMRQRAMIAMALACNPSLLIADEPTTALDVTIQAQIVELVKRLRDRFGMALIWITHDLGVVASLADRVSVMYAGYIVEEALVDDIYDSPLHPYTQALLRSLPRMDREADEKLEAIEGLPPEMVILPPGCPFAPRCKFVTRKCHEQNPSLEEAQPEHRIACWVDIRTGELR
jgi:oligopeptide transport system ATP-binding protein